MKNESVEFLENHCEFKDSHDCYVLLAVSRKKDSPDITNSKEIVFREVLRKPEDIGRKYKRLKLNCQNYSGDNDKKYPFYIYITVNARNGKKASKIVLDKIIDCYYEESKGNDRSRILNRIDREFISALMMKQSRGSTKYFVIDVDTKVKKFLEKVLNVLLSVGRHMEKQVYYSIRPTRHGYHIKTIPFDIAYFNSFFDAEEHAKLVSVNSDRLMFVEYVSVERGI